MTKRDAAVLCTVFGVFFLLLLFSDDEPEPPARPNAATTPASQTPSPPAPVAQTRTRAQAVGACGGAIRETLRGSAFRAGNVARPSCETTTAGGFTCLGSVELENVAMTATFRCDISPSGRVTLDALGMQ